MSIEQLRATMTRLHGAATALSALGAALSTRVEGSPPHGEIARHVDGVLSALGLEQLVEQLPAEQLAPLLAELRTFAISNDELLFHADRTPGWRPSQARQMHAAGEATMTFPQLLARTIAPRLDDLLTRLEAPDAAFLDIGAGVGRLSIEMARSWPQLRVVALEPWASALRLARENVRASGLSARIELREQLGEQLEDVRAFDLAWIPSLFVSAAVLPSMLARVRRALRPRGWLLFPTLRQHPDPLIAATARLRTASWGGSVLAPDEAHELLQDAGFERVLAIASSPSSSGLMLAGRAPNNG